uniref:Cathepsin 31 n=1 Tax=Philasterides dicentrarchi TaxID=282688 RepID=A0A481SCD8_9CILI|nr:cathepsin 31 [Philasterides dicentrarchi]
MGTDRANYKLLSKEELPETWEWSNINGTNFLTLGRNQHIPEYCGSCWAFSATSAVSDRIKIMRNAQWPDISISPQVLLSCSNKDDGCHGGEMMTAYEYMYRYNITDETCSSYQALGRDNGLPCSKQVICKNCSGLGASTKCWEQETYRSYTVTEFAEISGELAMMNEIKARGPITCAIAVPKSLFEYKDGVYVDKTGAKTQTHGISVVGWGVENGTPYWLVRNSWGESWGIHGFFKVIRGVDNIGIEEQCSYAVPKDTWTEADKQQEEKSKNKNKLEILEILLEPNKFPNLPVPEFKINLLNKKLLLNNLSNTQMFKTFLPIMIGETLMELTT